MDRHDATSLLKKGLNNPILHNPILSALFLIENSPNISISDYRQNLGEKRVSLLAVYRRRLTRLSRKGGHIEGFEETIRSLAEQDSDTVQLVSIKLGNSPFHIAILVNRTGAIIGCFIAAGRRKI